MIHCVSGCPGHLRRLLRASLGGWLSGGIRRDSAARQLHLMAHVSRWLVEECRDLWELDDEAVEVFVASRRVSGYSGHRTSRSLVGLLDYLRGVGAVPARP